MTGMPAPPAARAASRSRYDVARSSSRSSTCAIPDGEFTVDRRPERVRQVDAAARARRGCSRRPRGGAAGRQDDPLAAGQGGRPPARAAAAVVDRARRHHRRRPRRPRPLPAPAAAAPVVARGRARGRRARWPRPTSTDLADRLVDELSGGQRQRVWLAMALAQETPILLLDEPTTFLDIAHQVEVLDLCRELNREQGRTLVAVLHDLNQACRYATRSWRCARRHRRGGRARRRRQRRARAGRASACRAA